MKVFFTNTNTELRK